MRSARQGPRKERLERHWHSLKTVPKSSQHPAERSNERLKVSKTSPRPRDTRSCAHIRRVLPATPGYANGTEFLG